MLVDFIQDTLIGTMIHTSESRNVDLPDAVAQRTIKSGRALPAGVRVPVAVERATVDHPPAGAETAEAAPGKPSQAKPDRAQQQHKKG